MSLLTEAVAQEQRRIERMIESYERKLTELPRGTLVRKCVKGNTYYYLQYRDGKRITSEYIGKDGAKVAEMREALAHRKHIQGMLKELRTERQTAQKMMEVRV